MYTESLVHANGKKTETNLRAFMEQIQRRDPHQPEFLQAVSEVAENVIPFILKHPVYAKAKILERIAEPERLVQFRVP